MSSENNYVSDNKFPSDIGANERQNVKGDSEEKETLMAKAEPSSPMKDIDNVLELCKFGRFHIRLLFTTLTGFIASVMVMNSTSYILPIAECDLDMNLKEKGLLTAMPFIGIFISTVISGFLIDTFGRILFLRIGYAGLLVFSMLSVCSQNYTMYAAAKFGEGLFSGTANTGVMSLTSEFCHSSVKDRVMLLLSSVGAMTQIIAPAMAWAILIHNWEWSLFDGALVLKTWNFYLLAITLWSLVSCIMYTTLPESPKFLVTQKKYVEARNVLINVYKENTRKAAESFPVSQHLNLWDKEINDGTNQETTQKPYIEKFRAQFMGGLRNVKPMLHRPYITYLIILSGMQIVVVGTMNGPARPGQYYRLTENRRKIAVFLLLCFVRYDVLRLWFPQLSTIVEHYNFNSSQNLCVLLDEYTASEKLKIHKTFVSNITEICVPHLSGTETYVNSIIIGLVCLVPYFISGILINKVGKKFLLILSGVICIGSLFGIRFASSKTMMVAFFSIDIAVAQTMKGLIQVILVDVFPTTIKSLAMALVIVFSRGGTLVGNISFPILLDMGCEIPFYTMIVTMIGLIAMAIFTPKKKISQNE